MSQLKPHITEKAYAHAADKQPVYTFRSAVALSKSYIKKQIEKEHKVHVTQVRTVTIPGKIRRTRTGFGRTTPVYKALVQVKKGEKIAGFDIEAKEPKEAKEAKS